MSHLNLVGMHKLMISCVLKYCKFFFFGGGGIFSVRVIKHQLANMHCERGAMVKAGGTRERPIMIKNVKTKRWEWYSYNFYFIFFLSIPTCFLSCFKKLFEKRVMVHRLSPSFHFIPNKNLYFYPTDWNKTEIWIIIVIIELA